MTSDFKTKRAGQSQCPQLSTEEWMAKKQAEKEGVYAVIDERRSFPTPIKCKASSIRRAEWIGTLLQTPC